MTHAPVRQTSSGAGHRLWPAICVGRACGMLQRTLFLALILIVPLCAATLCAQPTDGAVPNTLSLTPSQIEIGMFYGGAALNIEGVTGSDSSVVVVIRGPEDEQTFNKKVRAGPIWISSGKVTVSGAPTLFLALSSGPISSIANESAIHRHVLDTAAIKQEMHIDAGDDVVDEDLMRENYLALKMEQRKYQVIDDAVVLGAPEGDSAPFSIELAWPRTAQPAVYQVTAYELCDGGVRGVQEAELHVVKVGFPESIHAFALNRSAQYGALAVLLAVLGGFGIDFLTSRIFGSSVRGAH